MIEDQVYIQRLNRGSYLLNERLPCFETRDLGVADWTNGAILAEINRVCSPRRRHELPGLHKHDVAFQLNFVLSGSTTMAFGERGERIEEFQQGDLWLQPKNCPHAILSVSDAYEHLEMIAPAQFRTDVLD